MNNVIEFSMEVRSYDPVKSCYEVLYTPKDNRLTPIAFNVHHAHYEELTRDQLIAQMMCCSPQDYWQKEAFQMEETSKELQAKYAELVGHQQDVTADHLAKISAVSANNPGVALIDITPEEIEKAINEIINE